MGDQIRVLLIDDHPLVRAGVAAVLEAAPDLTVAGEAATGEEGVRVAVACRPSVVLLDLSMPGQPAEETVRALRESVPETRVIILSAFHDRSRVRALIDLGVRGYVVKTDAPAALRAAIRRVVEGGTWLSDEVADALTGEITAPVSLTPREEQLLALLREGHDAGRIAEVLDLGPQTVRNYLHQLYGKLGVSSRADALLWLRERDR